MVPIFGINYNSSEFNTYLVGQNSHINTQRKTKGIKLEAGLMQKSQYQWERDW